MTIHQLAPADGHTLAMGRRPRRFLLGTLALLAVLWGANEAASTPSSQEVAVVADVVEAYVPAAGASGLPPGWRLSHPEPGIYLVELEGAGVDAEVSLDVTSWDVPGGVTIIPLGHGAHELRFHGVDGPMDTAFELTAIVGHR